MDDLGEGLHLGAKALGCDLTSAQKQALLRYASLLQQWNSIYNLTALRDPRSMLTHHLLDCLAVVPPLRRHVGAKPFTLLDVGSGGGLPGVVLAIMFDSAEVTCVDTVGKKAAFIRQVASELTVERLHALHARVETLDKKDFDVVTARAFSSLPDLVQLTYKNLSKSGCWAAMKGRVPQAEIDQLPSDINVFHVELLQVPGLDAERCLVWMRPQESRPPL